MGKHTEEAGALERPERSDADSGQAGYSVVAWMISLTFLVLAGSMYLVGFAMPPHDYSVVSFQTVQPELFSRLYWASHWLGHALGLCLLSFLSAKAVGVRQRWTALLIAPAVLMSLQAGRLTTNFRGSFDAWVRTSKGTFSLYPVLDPKREGPRLFRLLVLTEEGSVFRSWRVLALFEAPPGSVFQANSSRRDAPRWTIKGFGLDADGIIRLRTDGKLLLEFDPDRLVSKSKHALVKIRWPLGSEKSVPEGL